MSRALLSVCFVFITLNVFGQGKKDSVAKVEGWSFGGLPVIAYNQDFGLQYGVIGNVFYYGDQGIRYPYYDHSIYLELTNTTLGDRRIILRYDARELIKEGRFRAELAQRLTSYRPFYGFNGYQSFFNDDFSTSGSDAFISPLFYAYEQNRINARATIEKNLFGQGKKYRLQTEVQLTYMGIQAPDREQFNKGKSEAEQAPDTATLYDQYVQWGIIPDKHKAGGTYAQFAVGGVIDTRDIEPYPSKGVFEEFMINYGLPLSSEAEHVVSLRLIHRHYQTLIKDRLVFAHRLQYRSFLNSNTPFYILQTLGGADDIRGIKFSRLMGDGVFGANAELRYKVFSMVIFNQNIYGALSTFFDTGIVTRAHQFDSNQVPDAFTTWVNQDAESWHHSAGIGVRGSLNQNFIVAFDYGRALDERDGESALYISLGWLF
ncbi:MAG: hypothetical protein ACJAZM_001757 [Cyclobacteriaceae bacterium]|jgi:hypothetical protein